MTDRDVVYVDVSDELRVRVGYDGITWNGTRPFFPSWPGTSGARRAVRVATRDALSAAIRRERELRWLLKRLTPGWVKTGIPTASKR